MADLSYVLTLRRSGRLQRCLDSWRSTDSLRQFLLVMAGMYVASLAALFHAGLRPAVPWGFALLVPTLLVPFAIIFYLYSKQQIHPMLDIAAAASILVLYNVFPIWPIIALALLAPRAASIRQYQWRLLFDGMLTIILGYATLWNFNYLLARFVSTVNDPVLRATDQWLYSWFLSSVNYTDFFPIVDNDFLLLLLNNAYSVLFPEIMLVLFLVCQTGESRRVSRFLKGLFALYAVGVLCFLMYPAIGPCLYYPESLDPTRTNFELIQGMRHDYHAAVNGEDLIGYGYFIAVPSLHVMAALYLQRCLIVFPRLYRVFLPVNLTLIASTVVLGYHYLVDALIAVILMGAWMLLHKSFRI